MQIGKLVMQSFKQMKSFPFMLVIANLEIDSLYIFLLFNWKLLFKHCLQRQTDDFNHWQEKYFYQLDLQNNFTI